MIGGREVGRARIRGKRGEYLLETPNFSLELEGERQLILVQIQ